MLYSHISMPIPEASPTQPELSPDQHSRCMRHAIDFLPGSITGLGAYVEARYLGVAMTEGQPWEVPLYPDASKRLEAERAGMREAPHDQLEGIMAGHTASYSELKESWSARVAGHAMETDLVVTLSAGEARRLLPGAPADWFGAGEFRGQFDRLFSEIFTNEAGEPVLVRYKEGKKGSNPTFDTVNLDRLNDANPELLPWLITDFHEQVMSANLRRGMQRNLLLHEVSPADVFPYFAHDLAGLEPDERTAMLHAIQVYTARLLQVEPALAPSVASLIESVTKTFYVAPDVAIGTVDILDHDLACPATDWRRVEQSRHLKQVVDAIVDLGGERPSDVQGALALIGENPYKYTEHHYDAALKFWQSELGRQRTLLNFVEAARLADDQEAVFAELHRLWPEANHRLWEFQQWLGPNPEDGRMLLESLIDDIVNDVWLTLDQPMSRELVLEKISERAERALPDIGLPRAERSGDSPYKGPSRAHIDAALEMAVLVRLRSQTLEAKDKEAAGGMKPFKEVADVQDTINQLWQAQYREVDRITRFVRELPAYRAHSQALVAETGLKPDDIERLIAMSTIPEEEAGPIRIDESIFRALFHALALERTGILPSVRHRAFGSFMEALLYRGPRREDAKAA